jgi:hypothetical protein
MSARSEWTAARDATLERMVIHGFTNEQCAIHLETTLTSVMTRIARLKLREKITPSSREAVLRMYGEGTSLSRISMKTGLQQLSVGRVLVDAGLIASPAEDEEIASLRISLAGSQLPPVITERSDEFLEQLAAGIRAGRTQRQIAEDTGVSQNVVQRVVRERGLSERKTNQVHVMDRRREELQDLVDQGMSVHQISLRMGHDRVTVDKTIERLAIRPRRKECAA